MIAKNYREIFEEELNSWFTDESCGQKRDLKTFRQWFQVDFHGMVVDLSEEDFYTEE